MEYQRQAIHTARKEEQQDLSLRALNRDMKALKSQVYELDDDLNGLVRLVEVLSNS